MTIEEAIAILSSCKRDELRDHAFGDCEVTWARGEEDVAFGYFGGDGDEVSIGEHVFRGDDARSLRQCGSTGAVQRNDSTGPSEYAEGQCSPGLTPKGVLDELTAAEDS